jgi:hypothetical protein
MEQSSIKNKEFTTMGSKAPNRVNRDLLKNDQVVLEALQGMAGYTPVRTEFGLEQLLQRAAAMAASSLRETQERVEFEAARDLAAADEWAFHDAILGAKEQVRALFGSDSLQVQALGLKMKSKRKRPSQRNGNDKPGDMPA